MKNTDILPVIEKFIVFLKKQDEEVINGLINGNLSVRHQIFETKNNNSLPTPTWIPGFVEELSSISARTECSAVIHGKNLKKKELVDILRFLDIPVSKQDTKLKLIVKITEGTVGRKIRSEAIIKD